jgi:hypothetical protein
MGLNSTRVKGFLTRLKAHGKQEGFCLRCQLKLATHSPSFPTCPSHPRSVPLLCPTVLRLPHFLFELQRQVRHEVSENCSCSSSTSEDQSPTILSPREFLMGFKTCFFSLAPKLTRHTNTNGYGYGFRYSHENAKDISMGVNTHG